MAEITITTHISEAKGTSRHILTNLYYDCILRRNQTDICIRYVKGKLGLFYIENGEFVCNIDNEEIKDALKKVRWILGYILIAEGDMSNLCLLIEAYIPHSFEIESKYQLIQTSNYSKYLKNLKNEEDDVEEYDGGEDTYVYAFGIQYLDYKDMYDGGYVKIGDEYIIEFERDNPNDYDAIYIKAGDKKVAYLRREDYLKIRDVMLEKESLFATVVDNHNYVLKLLIKRIYSDYELRDRRRNLSKDIVSKVVGIKQFVNKEFFDIIKVGDQLTIENGYDMCDDKAVEVYYHGFRIGYVDSDSYEEVYKYAEDSRRCIITDVQDNTIKIRICQGESIKDLGDDKYERGINISYSSSLDYDDEDYFYECYDLIEDLKTYVDDDTILVTEAIIRNKKLIIFRPGTREEWFCLDGDTIVELNYHIDKGNITKRKFPIVISSDDINLDEDYVSVYLNVYAF